MPRPTWTGGQYEESDGSSFGGSGGTPSQHAGPTRGIPRPPWNPGRERRRGKARIGMRNPGGYVGEEARGIPRIRASDESTAAGIQDARKIGRTCVDTGPEKIGPHG